MFVYLSIFPLVDIFIYQCLNVSMSLPNMSTLFLFPNMSSLSINFSSGNHVVAKGRGIVPQGQGTRGHQEVVNIISGTVVDGHRLRSGEDCNKCLFSLFVRGR